MIQKKQREFFICKNLINKNLKIILKSFLLIKLLSWFLFDGYDWELISTESMFSSLLLNAPSFCQLHGFGCVELCIFLTCSTFLAWFRAVFLTKLLLEQSQVSIVLNWFLLLETNRLRRVKPRKTIS